MEARRIQNEEDLATEFDRHRDRLKRLVEFRMDQKLRRRLDASDVLQEAFLDLAKRLNEFPHKGMSTFVWFRLVTLERLTTLYRTHVGAKMRDVRRDISLQERFDSDETRSRIADGLVDQLTSVHNRAIAREQSQRLKEVLESMPLMDREIIAMRIFEDLSNKEIAEVLEISKHAASRRFLSAIERLRLEIQEDSPLPGGV